MDRVMLFSIVFIAVVTASVYAFVESSRPWKPVIWVEWSPKK